MKTIQNTTQEAKKLESLMLSAYASCIDSIAAVNEEIVEAFDGDLWIVEQVITPIIVNALKSVASQAQAGEAELGVEMGATTIKAAVKEVIKQLEIVETEPAQVNPATAPTIEPTTVTIEPTPASETTQTTIENSAAALAVELGCTIEDAEAILTKNMPALQKIVLNSIVGKTPTTEWRKFEIYSVFKSCGLAAEAAWKILRGSGSRYAHLNVLAGRDAGNKIDIQA